MSQQAMFVLILISGTIMRCSVQGFLSVTANKYPLMHYTKLISEEHFTGGRPLVTVLPLAEEGSTNEEVEYLIEGLHTSGRWPIILYNVSHKMNGNKYTEIHPHDSYILLLSGPCNKMEKNIFVFQKQLSALARGNLRESWNPSARFVVPVMSHCTHYDSTNTSRAILSHLWTYQISGAVVLFLKSNERKGNDLQQNTTDSAQDPYLELHTWYPYENSERCNPAEGTVPVKVFTGRNLSNMNKGEIFKQYFFKNFHKCTIGVNVDVSDPFVNPPKRVWYNDSAYQDVYEDGWDIELLRIIGNSLNISLEFKSGNEEEYHKRIPSIYAGGYMTLPSQKFDIIESTRNYRTARLAWYTPCTLKYQRWSNFFNIFSVDMWICIALSLILAFITARCISNYGKMSLLHESKSYSNIVSVTANILAVLLSVSVYTQPRSAPLRLFFFCWVCYSFAISTVFQAYLTTFRIETGHRKSIKTIGEMLKSDMKFGIVPEYKKFFADSTDPVDSEILKNTLLCPSYYSCLAWLTTYQNISTITSDILKESFHDLGIWIDENNRPLICEVENGVVLTTGFSFYISKETFLLGFINDLIDRIVQGGIFMHIEKSGFNKKKLKFKINSPTFNNRNYDIGISDLQTAFYFLMLGYVLAAVCFVTEIMWHRYRSKCCGSRATYLYQRQI